MEGWRMKFAGKLRLFPPKTSSKVVVVESLDLEGCNSSCDFGHNTKNGQWLRRRFHQHASSQDGNRHQNDFTIGHPKEPNFSRFTFHFKDYFGGIIMPSPTISRRYIPGRLFVQIEPSRSNQNRGHQKGSRYVSSKNR